MSKDPLRRKLVTLCLEMQQLTPTSLEVLVDTAKDDLAGLDLPDTRLREVESLLSGLYWGYRAAMLVERGDGAILQVRLADGVTLTHEWRSPRPLRRERLATFVRAIEAAFDAAEQKDGKAGRAARPRGKTPP